MQTSDALRGLTAGLPSAGWICAANDGNNVL